MADRDAKGVSDSHPVTCASDLPADELASLLGRFGITLHRLAPAVPIPGSFWGEPEAGIVGRAVYVRPDTPLHSLLHEACHIVCMTPARRHALSGDAGGDDMEESAVCYLQVLLGGLLPGIGKRRIMRDMDAWGYSFRLGCTARWFREDADDARAWLQRRAIIDRCGRPTFRLRAA